MERSKKKDKFREGKSHCLREERGRESRDQRRKRRGEKKSKKAALVGQQTYDFCLSAGKQKKNKTKQTDKHFICDATT